jgi:hypothetical protein
MADLPPAFFLADGPGRFVPTELARGPWDPNALHGGPPAALLADAVSALPAVAPMTLRRITIELLRPVPLAPLDVTTQVIRPGKRVQVAQATIEHDGVEVSRAVALRVAVVPDALPPVPQPADALPPPRATVPGTMPFERADRIGFGDAMELRSVSGSFLEPGPAVYWFRMRVPLVEGEPVSPAARVMVAADCGNGISQLFGPERYVFINPDLSVHLHRLPAGEWVGLDATTWMAPGAGAYAEGALYDELGRIGRSAQSLYVGPSA